MGDLSTRNTPQDWDERPLDEELLDWHVDGGEIVSFVNLLGKNIYQSQRHIALWISSHDSDCGWVGLTKDPSTEGGPRSVGVVLLLLMLEPMECFKSFHSQCQWRWWQGNVQSAVVLCTARSRTFARYFKMYFANYIGCVPIMEERWHEALLAGYIPFHCEGILRATMKRQCTITLTIIMGCTGSKRQVKSIVSCFSALSPSFSTQCNGTVGDRRTNLIT